MKVVQLSVFIENTPGRVSQITQLLGEAEVSIRGFSISDTAEYGILRVILDDPGRGESVLREAGFTVRSDDVLCVDLPDVPGGLASVLRVVAQAGVNVEYVYSLIDTYVVLNVEDVDDAVGLLKDAPVRMVDQEEISRA